MSSSHQRDYLKTGSIDDLPQTPVGSKFSKKAPTVSSLTQPYFDKNRHTFRQQVDGLKGLVNKFFEPNSDDELNDNKDLTKTLISPSAPRQKSSFNTPVDLR